MFIEIIGHVNEKGELTFTPPADLPVAVCDPAEAEVACRKYATLVGFMKEGTVRIMIEPFDAEAEAADEALWDAQFAASPELLQKMADEAHAQYLAGLTEDFDPDTDEISGIHSAHLTLQCPQTE